MFFSPRLALASLALSLASSVAAASPPVCYETQLNTGDAIIESLTMDRYGNFKGTVGAGHVEANFDLKGILNTDWTLKATSATASTVYKIVFQKGTKSYVFPIRSGQTCATLQFKSGGVSFTPQELKAVDWYYAV